MTQQTSALSLAVPPKAPDPESLWHLSLDLIDCDPNNPRKRFDDTKQKELEASIKEHGVIEPILVRLMFDVVASDKKYNTGARPYRIICGERRFQACFSLNLPRVPAIIREDITDAEVADLQIIENLQREGLTPLEEAASYRARLDADDAKNDGKLTVDGLARKLGKSPAYIYAKLKLLQLPQLAQQGLEDGRIGETTALLIARLPHEDMRTKAACEILEARDYYDADGQYVNAGIVNPLSFREAKSGVMPKYTRQLKACGFDVDSTALLPAAGSCKACPKRTGNNRVEYPEGREDICTDPSCFAKKQDAHAKAHPPKSFPGQPARERSAAGKLLGGNTKGPTRGAIGKESAAAAQLLLETEKIYARELMKTTEERVRKLLGKQERAFPLPILRALVEIAEPGFDYVEDAELALGGSIKSLDQRTKDISKMQGRDLAVMVSTWIMADAIHGFDWGDGREWGKVANYLRIYPKEMHAAAEEQAKKVLADRDSVKPPTSSSSKADAAAAKAIARGSKLKRGKHNG